MPYSNLRRTRRCCACLLAAAAVSILAVRAAANADEVIYVPFGASWAYRPGTGEASSPDPAAWRSLEFDDARWSRGAAPFGFGEKDPGTDLETISPPMRQNYTTLFTRREFEVTDLADVESLVLDAFFDDGFVAWINGREVVRANVGGEPGEPVAHDGTALRGREARSALEFEIAEPRSRLRAGTNVLAVQLFNLSRTSNDAWIDVRLHDPLGPDIAPPRLARREPAPGARVRHLGRVVIAFDEPVSGLDVSDLTLAGQSALRLFGRDDGPYIFEFPSPAPGEVEVAWREDHGIADLSPAANAFRGESWSYTLDPEAPLPPVVIAELSAHPGLGPSDEDRERPDWIELENRGAEPVRLGGLSLSDERDDPGKWTLPERTLSPGERLLVFASGKDRAPAGTGELHASFELDPAGEYLGLWSSEVPRSVIHEFPDGFPRQRAGHSWGLAADGREVYFENPTPGEPNDDSVVYSAIARAPIFSVEHGFFSGTFPLEISSPSPGARIVVTFNGSWPSADTGREYTGPLAIDADAAHAVRVVRAVALEEGLLPSDPVTRTYLFPSHVATQPADPEGFPRRWGSAPAADYAVDPEIVESPRYRDRFLAALLAIPTVSVVLDVDDMFGSQGIYANPQGEGVAWERAGSAELIPTDGSRGFSVNCGVRAQGGASRQPDKSPKHSLRLLFKGEYGPTRLRYPLFENSTVEEFDTVTLRAGYNNSWVHWDGAQRARSQYIRDQWARDTLLAMGQVSSHGRFVHLYINGLYWGVYNLVERPSAPFAADHLGGDKEEYDAYNAGAVVDGSASSWSLLMSTVSQGNLQDPERYAQLDGILDLEEFADYMITNLYGANNDWPGHNWYAARRAVEGGRLRFFSWDAERTLEGAGENRAGVSDGNSPGVIFSRLKSSAEFRLRFADRLWRHLVAPGGALTPQEAASRWEERAAQLEEAVLGESARWGDYRRDVHQFRNGPYLLYTVDDQWARERDRLVRQYFPVRTRNLLNQLRALGLYPRVEAPLADPAAGVVAEGTPVALSLAPGGEGTIWYTLDGSDPRTAWSGEVSPSALEYSSPLVARDRLHVLARVLGPRGWSALFESSWFTSGSLDGLYLSEIAYHPAGDGGTEFVELANRSEATMDLSGVELTRGIRFRFATGSTLAPGERAVLVFDPVRFAARWPAVQIAGNFQGRLDDRGEAIEARAADGSVLFDLEYDDEGFWPVAPDGFGPSLVLRDPFADPRRPESWRSSGADGGSPGAEDPAPRFDSVVIHEVLAGASPPYEDALELHNRGGSAVDVSGWFLSDDRRDPVSLTKLRLPGGTTIPPGGFAVLYGEELGGSPETGSGVRLSPGGGDLYLSAPGRLGVPDQYIVSARYPGAEPGRSSGRLLTTAGVEFAVLEAPTFGVAAPASPEEFRTGAGAPNAAARVGPVVINEIHYHPAEGFEFIELHNTTARDVPLWDARESRGWRLTGIRSEDGATSWEFPPESHVPAGGFLLLVPVEERSFRSLVEVPAEVPVVGPYRGALDNSGERLRLWRPMRSAAGEPYEALADEARYDDDDPWPAAADGLGSSLERTSPRSYGNEPLDWRASAEAGGSPGRANSGAPPAGNAPPAAVPTADPESGPAPLAVRLDGSASVDPDGRIERFRWIFEDGTVQEGETAALTIERPGSRAVVLRVTDDAGATASATLILVATDPAAGEGGQVPSDIDQNGRLNISDAVGLLGHLFLGRRPVLPCGDGSAGHAANVALLDADGDGRVGITDAIRVLIYLFRAGPSPALGPGCVPIPGCPDRCGL